MRVFQQNRGNDDSGLVVPIISKSSLNEHVYTKVQDPPFLVLQKASDISF